MEPRKRRVSEITPSTPSKRFKRLIDLSEAADGFPTTHAASTENQGEAQNLAHTRTRMSVVTQTKPSLVTPHNSFSELRRVSFLGEEPVVSPKKESMVAAASLGSFESSQASRTLELSLGSEPEELLIAPPSPDVLCRDALAETFDVKQYESKSICDTIVEVPQKDAEFCGGVESHQKTYDVKKNPWGLSALIAVALLYLFSLFHPNKIIEDPASICVPGGGFSGFWFTLGRLNSIEDPLSKHYYCYSAGCLGVVTMLSNITMESAYGYAVGAQKRWQRGELSRYDVTELFINGLLYGSDQQGVMSSTDLRPAFQDRNVLSTLRIITSRRMQFGGIKAAVRTPENAQELKDMLLQTTWIPYAISRDLWHQDHMDGAFTLHEHPRCPTNLGYGLDWDIIWNALNVNLGYDKVALLWQKGLAQGH